MSHGTATRPNQTVTGLSWLLQDLSNCYRTSQVDTKLTALLQDSIRCLMALLQDSIRLLQDLSNCYRTSQVVTRLMALLHDSITVLQDSSDCITKNGSWAVVHTRFCFSYSSLALRIFSFLFCSSRSSFWRSYLRLCSMIFLACRRHNTQLGYYRRRASYCTCSDSRTIYNFPVFMSVFVSSCLPINPAPNGCVWVTAYPK